MLRSHAISAERSASNWCRLEKRKTYDPTLYMIHAAVMDSPHIMLTTEVPSVNKAKAKLDV